MQNNLTNVITKTNTIKMIKAFYRRLYLNFLFASHYNVDIVASIVLLANICDISRSYLEKMHGSLIFHCKKYTSNKPKLHSQGRIKETIRTKLQAREVFATNGVLGETARCRDPLQLLGCLKRGYVCFDIRAEKSLAWTFYYAAILETAKGVARQKVGRMRMWYCCYCGV